MSTIILRPAAPEQKPALANLIQLYLYDMTESMRFPVGSDGRFEYDFWIVSGATLTSSCLVTRLPASRWLSVPAH